MTVAALFVDRGGVYDGRSDVELWPIDRDARTYPGPWPVVAHPPCETWGRLWWRTGRGRGDDGGCFGAALGAVRRFGGVLEHPAASGAWKAFALAYPAPTGGWSRGLFDPLGWVCHVEQGCYGHAAPKPTWLYYVGPPPPALVWGPSLAAGRVEHMPGDGKRRRATPPAFAAVLLDLAGRSSYRSPPETNGTGQEQRRESGDG